MSRKTQPEEEPEEEPEETPESSPVAGACVLVVLGAGATGATYAASPTAGILALWAIGGTALWRYVRRTANPAPPPPPERGSAKKPQFTVLEDRPGHCTVQWTEEAPLTSETATN
jgi:hypothetical protein